VFEPVEEPVETIEPVVEETAVEAEANEVIEPAETIELVEPAETIELKEPAETIEPVEPVKTIEPVEEPAKETEPILEDIVLENEVIETILKTVEPVLESVEPAETIEPVKPAKESEPIEIGIGAKVNEGRALHSSGMNLAPFSTFGVLFLSIIVLVKN
jgi:hypothetical protein